MGRYRCGRVLPYGRIATSRPRVLRCGCCASLTAALASNSANRRLDKAGAKKAFALPRSTPWLLHAARNSHGVDLGAGKQAVAEQALLVELPAQILSATSI